MFVIQVITATIWLECTHGVQCKYKKGRAEVFHDVIQERLPPMKKYATKQADFTEWGVEATLSTVLPERDCASDWLNSFRSQLGSLQSDPALVQELMGYLYLTNVSFARDAIGRLWNESVDFTPTAVQVTECAHQNQPLNAVLCNLLDDPSIDLMLAKPPSGNHTAGLTFAMNECAVNEVQPFATSVQSSVSAVQLAF